MIRDVHSGSGSNFLPIPDPGVKKASDPGSGSAALHKTVLLVRFRQGNNIGISFTVLLSTNHQQNCVAQTVTLVPANFPRVCRTSIE